MTSLRGGGGEHRLQRGGATHDDFGACRQARRKYDRVVAIDSEQAFDAYAAEAIAMEMR